MDSKGDVRNDAQDNVQNYQFLVEELLKTHPEEKKVKQLMQLLGMQYTDNSIDRLTEVLTFNPRNNKGHS